MSLLLAIAGAVAPEPPAEPSDLPLVGGDENGAAPRNAAGKRSRAGFMGLPEPASLMMRAAVAIIASGALEEFD